MGWKDLHTVVLHCKAFLIPAAILLKPFAISNVNIALSGGRFCKVIDVNYLLLLQELRRVHQHPKKVSPGDAGVILFSSFLACETGKFSLPTLFPGELVYLLLLQKFPALAAP